jgi:hypothetical protein
MADTNDSREKRKADARAYMRARYIANPEEFRNRSRAWRAANPEKARETERKSDAIRAGQPRYVYKGHKTSAKQRGVEFLLTFKEWWGIWAASGKWDQRGRQTGRYVMARFGDTGPYAIGNVRICTSQENNSEAHLGKQVSDATRKLLSEIAKARGPINDKQREALARGREVIRNRV